MTKSTAQQAAQDSRRPVICLGDSHTRGFYGASWLNILRPQFPHLRFINAGHDGETSEAIAARLPPLLESHPDPAAVLIFSGSNDCIAQESEQLQAWYKSQFRLSQHCSEQYALDNLDKMLQLVQEKAPAAKVIVLNGEGAMHACNEIRAAHCMEQHFFLHCGRCTAQNSAAHRTPGSNLQVLQPPWCMALTSPVASQPVCMCSHPPSCSPSAVVMFIPAACAGRRDQPTCTG
jgi:hypothetical protein